jgi:chromosomal replication initiator protein
MNNYDILNENWPAVLNKIKQDLDLTQISYTSWLEPIKLLSVENGEAVFMVPSGDMGIKVLNKKYTLSLKVAIAEITGLSLDICYVTEDSAEAIKTKKSEILDLIEKARLNPKYTFDTFVVGSNNKFANAAALAVAESPGEIYNPLYLYAGVGLGKTHLMHAIGNFILQNDPSSKVLYVTSEEFTVELINSIRNGNSAMMNFREKYRNIDVLLIDDIQFIIGKESTQEEFFHTFNTLYGSKKQIIISSDKPPRELDILEERIKSRLEMGLIADISAPDYETRMAILRNKEELEGFTIDEEVLDYIAKNVKSNIRELEGCLNTVRAKSIIDKKYITLEFAQEILKDYISPEKDRIITAEMIVEVVSEHYNISIEEIRSSMRNSKYVYPRKVAMYLCREMTAESLQSIALLLGKKDHTTVISACKNIEKDLLVSDEAKRNIEIIKKKLNSRL